MNLVYWTVCYQIHHITSMDFLFMVLFLVKKIKRFGLKLLIQFLRHKKFLYINIIIIMILFVMEFLLDLLYLEFGLFSSGELILEKKRKRILILRDLSGLFGVGGLDFWGSWESKSFSLYLDELLNLISPSFSFR